MTSDEGQTTSYISEGERILAFTSNAYIRYRYDNMSRTTNQADLDRRNSTRVDYAARITVCERRVALDSELADFRPVKASDLSQTGISFVTTVWPTDDRLVVCFGEGESARVIARIVSIRSEPGEAGEHRFDVACEFEQWLPDPSKSE